MKNLQPVSPTHTPGLWASLGMALVLILLAPSGDSFWIDEANSAQMALQPTLGKWWQAVNQIASDVQMSPYFLQLWVWAKLAGRSEWALRCNNLPWVFVGILAWFLVLPRSLKVGFALLAGLSPFLWYYASEIRPYAMLFGASSLMFASLFQAARAGINPVRLAGFGMGALFAIGASAAALPWVGIALLVFLYLAWKQRPDGSCLLIGGLLAIPAIGLAGLYLWSFSKGAQASSPEPSNLASLLFVPYELLGFTGLGPGRSELRVQGIGSIRPYLPFLGLLSISLAPVIIAGLVALRNRLGTARLLALVGLCAVPAIAVAVLGWKTGLRTTGRHFTPALGLLLPFLALGLHTLWQRRWLGQLTVACLLISLGFSSFQIRSAARHKKDNYREAARVALGELQTGRKLWWVADPCGADYYQVPLAERTGPGTARLVRNLAKIEGELPDVVVLSKPDVYDAQRTVEKLVHESGFQLKHSIQSFTVWEKRPNP